jgi:hypothetical protein
LSKNFEEGKRGSHRIALLPGGELSPNYLLASFRPTSTFKQPWSVRLARPRAIESFTLVI